MAVKGFKYVVPVTLAGRRPGHNGEPCVFFGNWKYPVELDPETNKQFVNMDGKIYRVLERKIDGPGKLYIEVEEEPFPIPALSNLMNMMRKYMDHPERYVLKYDTEPLLK
ncbi:MAG: hypothetical protein NTU57_05655 [Candidatus Aenigmarchaeota archaeon]|nr:hypothetical protein [Candidatus Aenigmarchaeota archaeon]